MKKLQTFDSTYVRGKNHFEDDVTQNYLVFQPTYRCFQRVAGVGIGNYIYFWKRKELSDENIKAPTTSDYRHNPQFSYLGNKTRKEFEGSCLKQDKITYTHGKLINIFIVYETSKNYNISSYPALENCLFGPVSLTENADIDKYKYSGYGTVFVRHGFYSHLSREAGRNVIIFGVDMSSSTNNDNRRKDILILGKGPTQELEHTLSAERVY